MSFICFSDRPPTWSRHFVTDFVPTRTELYTGEHQIIQLKNLENSDRGTYICEGEIDDHEITTRSNLFVGGNLNLT